MSKIDASVEETEYGSFVVIYGDKAYGFFTTRGGAEAYLEVLEHGERSINCCKTETLSSMPGVLQGAGSEGGDKS